MSDLIKLQREMITHQLIATGYLSLVVWENLMKLYDLMEEMYAE